MTDQDTVQPELEGGGWNWWYVCEECHGYLEWRAERCSGCGKKVVWDEIHTVLAADRDQQGQVH